MSLSARRAWIEISRIIISVLGLEVALRKESVDRNYMIRYEFWALRVALRKESVDRNTEYAAALTALKTVALRKESVDRNAVSAL